MAAEPSAAARGSGVTLWLERGGIAHLPGPPRGQPTNTQRLGAAAVEKPWHRSLSLSGLRTGCDACGTACCPCWPRIAPQGRRRPHSRSGAFRHVPDQGATPGRFRPAVGIWRASANADATPCPRCWTCVRSVHISEHAVSESVSSRTDRAIEHHHEPADADQEEHHARRGQAMGPFRTLRRVRPAVGVHPAMMPRRPRHPIFDGAERGKARDRTAPRPCPQGRRAASARSCDRSGTSS